MSDRDESGRRGSRSRDYREQEEEWGETVFDSEWERQQKRVSSIVAPCFSSQISPVKLSLATLDLLLIQQNKFY